MRKNSLSHTHTQTYNYKMILSFGSIPATTVTELLNISETHLDHPFSENSVVSLYDTQYQLTHIALYENRNTFINICYLFFRVNYLPKFKIVANYFQILSAIILLVVLKVLERKIEIGIFSMNCFFFFSVVFASTAGDVARNEQQLLKIVKKICKKKQH